MTDLVSILRAHEVMPGFVDSPFPWVIGEMVRRIGTQFVGVVQKIHHPTLTVRFQDSGTSMIVVASSMELITEP